MSKTKIPTDLVVYSDTYKVDDWIWGAKLGEGAFGSVKSCTLMSDKSKKVAIKVMKKKTRTYNEHIDNEKEILS